MKTDELFDQRKDSGVKELLSYFENYKLDIYVERPTLEIIFERLQSFDQVLADPNTDDSMHRYYQGKYNGLAEMCHSLGTPGYKKHYTKKFIGRINADDWNHYEI
jgi:hypothetical protein